MQPLSKSVGPLIKISKLGKRYWEAVGSVQRLFQDELAPAIKDYLDRCIEPPQHYLYWSIYMRGFTAETAKPYLVFSSEDEKTRKRARWMVKESNILTKFPAVKTTHTRYPPDLSTRMRLLGDQVLDQGADAKHNTHMVRQGIYYKASGNSMALELIIDRISTGEPGRRATAGGIVCVGDRSFFLTVYHILEQEEHQQSVRDHELGIPYNVGSLNSERPGAEYEEEGEDDDEDNDEEDDDEDEEHGDDDSEFEDSNPIIYDGVTTTSDNENQVSETSGQLNGKPRRSCENNVSDPEEDLLITPHVPLHSAASRFSRLGFTRLNSNVAIGSRSLDYLLLEVHNEDQKKTNMIPALQSPSQNICVRDIAPVGNESRRVIIPSAFHGISGGYLLATPRFVRPPKATVTRKTFALQLDRYVQPGDCGSWAIDESSGYLYGHIFGGGIGTKIAYIIPAVEIFEDIQRSFGQPVFLPSANDERNTVSGVSQPSLSGSLQVDPPQGNESAPGKKDYHAVLSDVINDYHHPVRNIADITAKDAPQAHSPSNQEMRNMIGYETSEVSADCMDPNLADLSLKATSDTPDIMKSTSFQESSSPKESKSSAVDGETSCWSYKPESGPPIFYYAP